MKTSLCVWVCMVLAALVGCNKSSTPSSQDNRNGEPSASDKGSSPAAQTDPTPPKNGDSPDSASEEDPRLPTDGHQIDDELRDRFAALLIADQQGGWIVDQATKESLDDLGPEARSRMLPLLTDESVNVRRGVVFYLVELDFADPEIARAFRVTMDDDDPAIRHMGLQSVKRMPREIQIEAAPQLAALLGRDDEPPKNRSEAARRLASLGADAHDVLPQVVRVAREDPHPLVRNACLYAVSKIATRDEAVALYRDVLTSDPEATVRIGAIVRLGGLNDATVVNDLADALEDVDQKVREEARDALVGLGAAAVDALIAQLESKHAITRESAIFALGKLGSVAKPALPALKKRLEDENESVRQFAAVVIERIENPR